MSHIIGGEYRKLATMTAENYEDLLKARAGILKTLFDDSDNKSGKAFSEICGSHQDYLWDIKIESRQSKLIKQNKDLLFIKSHVDWSTWLYVY